MTVEAEVRFVGEMQRLVPQPGDVFVVHSQKPVPQEVAESIRRQVRAVFGEAAKVVVVDQGLRLGVMAPAADDMRPLLEQVKADLASAHAEIVKLQGGDPARLTWPVWSPQAHTLAWIDRVLAEREN